MEVAHFFIVNSLLLFSSLICSKVSFDLLNIIPNLNDVADGGN